MSSVLNNKWVSSISKALIVYILIYTVLFFIGKIEAKYLRYGGFDHIYASITLAYFKYFLIGLILGLGSFIEEFKKIGKWSINIFKIVAFGIPSLLISLINPFSIGAIDRFIHGRVIIHALLKLVVLHAPDLIHYSQAFLGYIIITIFYKKTAATPSRQPQAPSPF